MSGKEFLEAFRYELVSPLKYANGGQVDEASYLEIFAPKSIVQQYTSLIETEVNKAVFEMSAKVGTQVTEEAKKDAKIQEDDAESQRQSIYPILSTYGDLNKCYLALKAILTSKEFCMVDGVNKLTAPLFDDLSMADTREILVSYILNFLNTSLSN